MYNLKNMLPVPGKEILNTMVRVMQKATVWSVNACLSVEKQLYS